MFRVPGFIARNIRNVPECSVFRVLSTPLCRRTLRFHSQLPPKHWTQNAWQQKKIRVNLERTPHEKHLNVSLEVKWIETPVRKAISALKTRKPTHSLIFNEAAKLLVGRRCVIMLISSKNWTFHFRWPSFHKKRKENCILLDLCPNDHDAL